MIGYGLAWVNGMNFGGIVYIAVYTFVQGLERRSIWG